MRRTLSAVPAQTVAVGVAVLAILAGPAGAHAARLIGGREQSAIARAFFARGAHRGLVIVSTRSSSVARAWTVVKAVRPEVGDRTSASAHPVRLQSAYYHVTGRLHVRSGDPPAAARADLAQDFRIAIVYRGSGAETIAYHQLYRSVCAGQGGFTDTQDDTITPMSWNVRYVVDLDHLLSAVRSPAGTVLVPSVSLAGAQSSLSVRESLTRTVIDVGCDGQPTTFACSMTYGLSGSDSLLSFPAAGGLEVGVPTSATTTGDCDPADYTLGPSLWDSGATTAFAGGFRVIGAGLPADPYAPVRVSWPADSAAAVQGFVASPCQGDGAACRDSFTWTGQIALEPVAPG